MALTKTTARPSKVVIDSDIDSEVEMSKPVKAIKNIESVDVKKVVSKKNQVKAKVSASSDSEAEIVVQPIVKVASASTSTKKKQVKKEASSDSEAEVVVQPIVKSQSVSKKKQISKIIEAKEDSDEDEVVVIKKSSKAEKEKKTRKPHAKKFKAEDLKRPMLFAMFVKQYKSQLPEDIKLNRAECAEAFKKFKEDKSAFEKLNKSYQKAFDKYKAD